MRARAFTALLTAIGVAALLLPGAVSARARPASRQTAPSVSAQLSLPGTNGFRFGATLTDRRRLVVGAGKFGEALQVVSYKLAVRPRRGVDRIVARLGKLGRIDVRFVPEKVRHEKPPEGCHGPKAVVEEGDFVGAIAFHGEAGFTEVRSHRAPGAIVRTPAFTCEAPSPPPNLKKLERELEAREAEEAKEAGGEEEAEDFEAFSVGLAAKARGGHVTLTAQKAVIREKHRKGFAITNIAAIGERRRGRIAETSATVYVFGRGSTFLVPNRKEPASEGILKPPAPFSGTGTFRRHPKGPPTWTGDLKIALPGFGQVRLAGPGTHAAMCEGADCPRLRTRSARGLLRGIGVS